MEEVLDVYHEPHDPKQPVVCFDESSTQLLADVREPTAARPGQPERYDTEYRRQGTRNLFMFIEPLAGYRHVAITERRTRQDFAHQMKWLVDEAYPEADTVRVVLDNLNTHRLGSLYVAFVPDEARRIARRLRFHYIPKHGSWLNPVSGTGQAMAEIELSVFSRGCLRRRVPDETVLRRRVHALQEERNTDRASIDWRFSIQDARSKLHRLYPSNN